MDHKYNDVSHQTSHSDSKLVDAEDKKRIQWIGQGGRGQALANNLIHFAIL